MINQKYKLFFEQDEVISNSIEGNTRWVVSLSNGLKVYQDDCRQYDEFTDERRYSTWVRLREYCKEEKIDIVGMYIQFRTNIEHLLSNMQGYYFCKSVLGMFGTTETLQFFITGIVVNGQIHCKKWRIPELVCAEEMIREIKDDDLCLILNKGK